MHDGIYGILTIMEKAMNKRARAIVSSVMALIMSFSLCMTAGASQATEQPIYSASNMTFSTGTDAVEIPAETVSQLSDLTGGTIIVEFKPTTTTVATSLISLSNSSVSDAHFHLYVDNRGFLGIEVRNAGETRYVNLQAPIEVISNTTHKVAFTASPTDGYKFYYNGDLIYHMPIRLIELWEHTYRFMSTVENVNVGHVGATNRGGTLAYPFYGEINDLRVYSSVWSEASLKAETYIAKDSGIIKQENVFSFEDWDTKGIRIPAVIRTAQNTIIATGDIRYGDAAGTSNDPPNNCDIGIRVSNDGGQTWSTPEMLLNFLDYPNEPQVPIQKDSASYCDSLLVNGHNGRVFFFCDAVTGWVRAPYAAATTGYTDDGHLILKDSEGTQYELHEDDGRVYLNGVVTEYTVGEDFTLYKNGAVAGNIFYYNFGTYSGTDMPKKTELRVLETVFLVMCYSDDGGYTWSAPKLMNLGLKTSDMKHFGASPGIGITIQSGADEGRILAPIYYNSSSYSGMSGALLYSDDNGETWHLGESPNDALAKAGLSKISMGEIQIVEMPAEGDNVSTQIKMFIRQSGGVRIATSYDGGETWAPEMPLDSTLVAPVPYGGCQQSVINYSQYVDGKPAVIFANAAANSRANGTIRIGLIEESGTNAEGRKNYTFDWKYSRVIRAGEFGYSSLMEMPNGNIVCLYEQESRPDNILSLVYAEYTLDYIKRGNNPTGEPILLYSNHSVTVPDAEGQYAAIDTEALNQIKDLEKGTILVRFTPTSTNSNHSLIGFSNSTAGNQNSYFTLYYSANRLGFEIRRQEGGDFEKNYANVTIQSGQEYCAAITADPEYGYQLFLNGTRVLDLPLSELTTASGYGFIGDIPGVDAGYLGKTRRVAAEGATAAFEYPFTGEIDTVQVFDGVFSSEHMQNVTYVAANASNIYSNSDLVISQESEAVQIDPASMTSISAMSSGTIVVEFAPQLSSTHSLVGISNNTSGNNDSHFHLYVRSGAVGYEIRRQSGGDFAKSSASVNVVSGSTHRIAFVADPASGYKVFFDGDLVHTLSPSEYPTTGYGFISSIEGINSGYVGKTDRNSGFSYPYSGAVDSIKFFDAIIPDSTLAAWTQSGGF